jgi:hypothetical protein
MLNKNKVGLIALFVGCAASELFAGTLTNYVTGDVLVCFRKSGSANDLVVDAGPFATYTNTTVNQRIPVNQYAGNQLGTVGTNSVTFSAFTALDDGTLFMTRHRVALYSKTSAWTQYPQDSQLLLQGDMGSIVSGAAKVFSTWNVLSTPAAVIEPDDVSNSNPNYGTGGGQSYYGTLGTSGNFNGDFQGNVEITAPANFTTAGAVIRSDFYMIPPSDTSAAGVAFLGYFELNTNGVMTFVANPTPPTVTTVAAGLITKTNAQLNCTVNPNADSTTLFFQYGLTTSYGSNSVTSSIGTTSGSYGLSISNLTAGTTYHFRVAAANRTGTNYGGDLAFTTTGGAPTIPVVSSIGRSNGISYVRFTTGSSGTYSLRGTNSAGLMTAPTNWPVVASALGSGTTITLQDTNSQPNQFYIITAQ